jgi:hypothetical protein
VIVKNIYVNGINKSAIITRKEVITTNQLNYKAPEKTPATEELVGYKTFLIVRRIERDMIRMFIGLHVT